SACASAPTAAPSADDQASVDPPEPATTDPSEPATTDPSEPADGSEYVLENGLRVVLRPERGSGQVAVLVSYDIGELHDPAGLSGLAHFAEHLYITAGTAESPPRTVDEFVADHPLGWNAQTTRTASIFAAVATTDRLTDELTDAAGRMTGLTITPDLVETERGRILAETSNMFGGIPVLAAQNLAKEAVAPTPGDGRRGGDPDTLASLDVATLESRLDEYYKPTNAMLVVTGDFDADATAELIASLFGGIAPGTAIGAPAEVEPAPPTIIDVTVPAPDPSVGADDGIVALGLAMPAGDAPTYPAALVLVQRLFVTAGQGDIQVGYALLEDPTVLTVSTAIAPDEDATTAVERLTTTVADVVAAPLGPSEASTVVSQFGPLLGIEPYPSGYVSQNPYQPALTAALGSSAVPDPAAVRGWLGSLTPEQLAAAADLLDPAAAGVVTITHGPG
ncbi:MAG: insulinase family protein, partial [Acidimicrobiia bacterium]|nr:insulinase family protein [Acidimicrobiia bacterium]